MPMKQIENSSERATTGSTIVSDVKKNFGIDIGDIAKDLTRDYVKSTIFGQKAAPVTRSKFSRALDAVASFSRSMWWVPAAAYLVLGIAVIAVKLLAKLAGV